jgi:hypothetical protein
VRPFRDDLNKRPYVVWHKLPYDLVVRAKSFYRDEKTPGAVVGRGGITSSSSVVALATILVTLR